jgi:hypothetical protein
MTKILIATPCAHESVTSSYAATLHLVTKLLERSEVESELSILGASDLEFARSVLASRVLADASFTHLLFIDSDMSFRPSLVERMLAFDGDVMSAICPRRTQDLARIVAEAVKHPPADAAALDAIVSRAADYAGQLDYSTDAPGGNWEVQIEQGFARARETGMAICLIKRRVLEVMVERKIVERRAGPSHPNSPWPVPYFGFFHCKRVADGHLLSEDISFCRRWTEACGGTIWASVDEEIGHHGAFRYYGKYLERLKTGQL